MFAYFDVVGGYAAERFGGFIFAVFAGTFILQSVTTIYNGRITIVLRIGRYPVVAISPRGGVASSATVAAIETAVKCVLLAARVHETSPTLAQTTVCLRVVGGVQFDRGWWFAGLSVCWYTGRAMLRMSLYELAR